MKAIGIDVGGTEVKGAVISDEKHILHTVKIPTKKTDGREGILTSIYEVIDSLWEKAGSIAGIGVGTAGRVNVHTGEVVFATANLPSWQGTKVKEIMEQRYGVPCFVENDANAALIGEEWKGRVNTSHSSAMITLGTGVGGAFSQGGRIINGHHYQSGEWGHMILVPNGKPCNCGKKGCLEQYLSGSALVEMVRTETDLSFQHGSEIFEAYAKRHDQVKQIVDRYIDHLAIALYNLTISVDPEVVYIGGGVIDSKEHWWEELTQKLLEYEVQTAIVPAVLGNQSGMVGAAKLVFDRIKKRGESL